MPVVMGRFGHENGPFWMLAGAVLVLFFLLLGPFWFVWAVFDLYWGRFGDGPFWSVPFRSLIDYCVGYLVIPSDTKDMTQCLHVKRLDPVTVTVHVSEPYRYNTTDCTREVYILSLVERLSLC